ncbi:MAG: hypothetical protein U5K00_11165 [Melioribacteraceae bacterium]|nr:hypothetical protein [Melioribacteraceae bacterium]
MRDEELYQVVRNELQDGIFDEDLWQRALAENNNNKVEAEDDYIEWRVDALKQSEDIPGEISNVPETGEPKPSREPVKKRNIIIGISLLILLFIMIILLGFLLHDYFN